MWEIITSRDFLLNLAAGGVIFVLEVVLIVMLLPLFLQRRLDKRWKPVREAIARAFDRSVTHALHPFPAELTIRTSSHGPAIFLAAWTPGCGSLPRLMTSRIIT